MITDSLSDDVLHDVKGKLTMMSIIGLEAVNPFFQQPPMPAITPKPPKIVLRINDVSSGHENEDQRLVLLTLHDKRKKRQWKIEVKLNELDQTFAKMFIRMKYFHSLRICVVDDAESGIDDSLSDAERLKKKKMARRLAFETMLSRLSVGLISAASSLPPQQSITIRRLFFPPHSAAMTTLQDGAFNLISFLSPSLVQLRLSTNHSDDILRLPTQCRRLLVLIAAKCTGLQKLKIGGDCGVADWPLVKDCLRSLTNLRSFAVSALDTRSSSFQLPPNWFHQSFELAPNLTSLSISFKILAALTEPSALPILSQLVLLIVSFDSFICDFSELNSRAICRWIIAQVRNAGQGSLLLRVLIGMSPGSQLSMQLQCSGDADLSLCAEWLVKTILTLAALTKKSISATFLRCHNMLAIVERLQNAHPLAEVKQTSSHCITVRDGTATCVFNSE